MTSRRSPPARRPSSRRSPALSTPPASDSRATSARARRRRARPRLGRAAAALTASARLDAVVHGASGRRVPLVRRREAAPRLRGWVANEAGGRVRCVGRGPESGLDSARGARPRRGPPGARVDGSRSGASRRPASSTASTCARGWHAATEPLVAGPNGHLVPRAMRSGSGRDRRHMEQLPVSEVLPRSTGPCSTPSRTSRRTDSGARPRHSHRRDRRPTPAWNAARRAAGCALPACPRRPVIRAARRGSRPRRPRRRAPRRPGANDRPRGARARLAREGPASRRRSLRSRAEGPGRTPDPGRRQRLLAGYRVRFDEAGPDGHVRTSTLLGTPRTSRGATPRTLGFDRAGTRPGARLGRPGVELELHEPIPMGDTCASPPPSLAIVDLGASARRVPARRWAARGEGHHRLGPPRRPQPRSCASPIDFGVAFTNPRSQRDPPGRRVRGEPVAHHGSASGRELDPLDHVNNAVYVDWLAEALERRAGRTPIPPAGAANRVPPDPEYMRLDAWPRPVPGTRSRRAVRRAGGVARAIRRDDGPSSCGPWAQAGADRILTGLIPCEAFVLVPARAVPRRAP